MRKKELEKQLRRSLHGVSAAADRKHVEETKLLAGREVLRKSGRERISFLRFLVMQVKFIGWRVWTLQIAFLLVIRGAFHSFYGRENLRYMVRLLVCLSVMVLMMALPIIYRCVRYRMQEVEAASRFSSVKLLMAKLAMIGIGDLIILCGIFAAAVWGTSLRADRVFAAICLPFLLAGSGCLYMLGHFKAKQFFAGSMGWCSLFILLSAVWSEQFEALFCRFLNAGGIILCVLLTVFCICQFRYIMYRSPYAEMQIA